MSETICITKRDLIKIMPGIEKCFSNAGLDIKIRIPVKAFYDYEKACHPKEITCKRE
jgi:hypothetical protein